MDKKMFEIVSHAFMRGKICILCQRSYSSDHALCPSCLDLFIPITYPCEHCGHAMPSAHPRRCGQCIKEKDNTIDKLQVYYDFIEPLRSLLHLFKYHQGLYLSSTFSALIYQNLKLENKPQVLIPVPIHPNKMKKRGFNQADLISKKLSRMLNIPNDNTSCIKAIHTPSQTSLSAEDRKTNLIQTFKVKPLSYQSVALIDDVYTTGSTLRALAYHLKASGVSYVEAWCVARTKI